MNFNPLAVLSAVICFIGLQACSGSSSSLTCSLGTGANITVSGKATFDRVPLLSSGGLDFSNTTTQPVKGALVEAVCNDAIATATSDANGNYSLSIPGDTRGVFIRVKAQLVKTGTPSWNVKVTDESQPTELIFSMDGSVFNSTTENLTRNLHADSGWSSSGYATPRVAAPFAILDTVYDSMQLVLSANAAAQFPALNIRWSAGSTEGTFYSSSAKTISVLGRITDTDEFDEHVIAHEWGHYFQDAFSRDDSIGGQHSGGDILDIRVAFSEGFGNAFSAMVTGDPVYKDSQSVNLQNGFTINIENNTCTNEGWYNECSVQSVLYDFFDTANDDSINVGFTPIYTVLTNDMPVSNAATSIFSFINPFKADNTGISADIDALLAIQDIQSITDDIGSTMTTQFPGGGGTNQLPIYDTSAFTITLCTTGEHGGYNGLGVTRFAQFTVPATGSYTFIAQRQSGLSSTDPDLYIRAKGELIAAGESTVSDRETLPANLTTGVTYVLELQEFAFYAQPDYSGTGQTCFTVSRT